MKILAIEYEKPGLTTQDFAPYARAEAYRVWELQQQDIIREIYFRANKNEAVLLLECEDVIEAEEILKTLPLVEHGLITFELIPLAPYPGFARLFSGAG